MVKNVKDMSVNIFIIQIFFHILIFVEVILMQKRIYHICVLDILSRIPF